MASGVGNRASRTGTRAPARVDEARRAVIDAATRLFTAKGVDAVSLRDVAAESGVHTELIRRYVGHRHDLVRVVFEDVSWRLVEAIAAHPLEGQGFDADSVMGQWVRIAAGLAISGRQLPVDAEHNPVTAMAATLVEGYGVDSRSAQLRAAQIVATALGWRVFEDYLVEAGGLGDVPLQHLREELVHSGRRLGATPWPSPPDPSPRRG